MISGALVAGLFLRFAVPSGDGALEADFQRYFGSAIRLRNSLDYERALLQLHAARESPHRASDEVTLTLYEGVILFELYRKEQALESFRAALSMDLDARFPEMLSPVISAALEAERKRLAAVAGRVPPSPTPTEPSNPERSPSNISKNDAQAPDPAPPLAAGSGSAPAARGPTSTSRRRTWALAPAAAGFASAGAGATFLFEARRRYLALQHGTAPAGQAAAYGKDGNRDQIIGWSLAGLGVAVLGLGLTLYLVPPSPDAASMELTPQAGHGSMGLTLTLRGW
jgi:hypothetical protein